MVSEARDQLNELSCARPQPTEGEPTEVWHLIRDDVYLVGGPSLWASDTLSVIIFAYVSHIE
jgi:hypothetical protein